MTINFADAHDLTPKPPTAKQTGLAMRNEETGQESFVEVTDHYPQLADHHFEGRRTVTLSVEAFVELSALAGFKPFTLGHPTPLIEEETETTP